MSTRSGRIRFDKFTLSNGLDVILHEDHSIPIAAVNIWYRVGSQHEDPQRTGFAHLFEHIMFRGSKHHNRGYFLPLQELGANVNGSTSVDRTNYFENVPAEYLELALWLEADRMGFLLDALDESGFAVEREVVKNERRQSYENRPYGLANQELRKALFPPDHPYHWQTIGSQEHLDAASTEEVKDFFRRFYAPNNASLAIAGDIDVDEARRLVQLYFGDLPPGPPVPRLQRWIPRVDREVQLTIEDRVQLHRLYFAWAGPPRFDADEAPLDVLVSILGEGRSSRLYRALVYEQERARTVAATYSAMDVAGEINLEATVAPGSAVSDVERALLAEVARLQDELPRDDELERVLNRLEAQYVHQLEGVGGFRGRANLLNYFNVFAGDPDRLNTDFERYRAVSPSDVQRIARVWLGGDRVRLLVAPMRHAVSEPSSVDRTHQPGPGQPRDFHPPIPTRLQLSNGIDLLVVEKRAVPMIATAVYFPGGALVDPPELPGLASFGTRLFVEGTTSRSSAQIADASDFIAARLNVNAHREYTVGSVSVLTPHWPAALDLLTDVLANPTFVEREVERVRRERVTDLRRLRDDANAIAERISTEVLYGRDTPYGHPAAGRIDSITSIERAALLGYHDGSIEHTRPTVLIVGDVDAESAARRMEANLAVWSPAAPAPLTLVDPQPQDTTVFLVDRPGAAQSVIAVRQLTVSRSHPDYLPLQVMNMAFGGQFTSRLNTNLRVEKGFTYGYRSRFDWRLGRSSFAVGGAVQTAVTGDALVETFRELRALRERPIDLDEFDRARQALIRGYPPTFETVDQLTGRLIDLVHFGLPDDYFMGQVDRLRAVSLADVQRVVEEHVHPGALSVVLVGDRAAIETSVLQLGLPIVHLDYEGLPAD
jgi:predicted Zn-dependent peptidase